VARNASKNTADPNWKWQTKSLRKRALAEGLQKTAKKNTERWSVNQINTLEDRLPPINEQGFGKLRKMSGTGLFVSFGICQKAIDPRLVGTRLWGDWVQKQTSNWVSDRPIYWISALGGQNG
jgi:hypothetical protein